MARYVILGNWTDQGVKNVKDTTQRVEQARAQFESLGVRLETVLWTLGRYDTVVVAEAPDDEAITTAMLRLGMAGNTRTETLRAFTAQEIGGILGKLG
jgi:uncharacterized protein with GYD domain